VPAAGDPFIASPVSIAVLPGGTVHTWSTVMSQASDLRDGTHPAWSAAAWQARHEGRPTPVSVGHPDGRVEAYLVAADGTAVGRPGHHLPVVARQPPDPCWGEPGTLDHDLCNAPADPAIAAALDRAAQAAAQAAQWENAVHLFTVAAARHQHLPGGPGRGQTAAADRAVEHAVSAWLRTVGRPGSAALGFTLVHLLITGFPGRPGPIAALLRRLADHLPAASHTDLRYTPPPEHR
jgi:hypothetical protein